MGLAEPLEQELAPTLVPVVASVPFCSEGSARPAPEPAKGRIRNAASVQDDAEAVWAIRVVGL